MIGAKVFRGFSKLFGPPPLFTCTRAEVQNVIYIILIDDVMEKEKRDSHRLCPTIASV